MTTNGFLIGLVAFLILHSTPAQAFLNRWFVPTQLPGELLIQNKSDRLVEFWLGHPLAHNSATGEITYEIHMTVMPHMRMRIPLANQKVHAWMQVKAHDDLGELFQVKLRKFSGEIVDLPMERSARFKSKAPRGFDEMLISSLSELDQTIEIKTWKNAGIERTPHSQFVQLPGKSSIVLPKDAGVSDVEVSGSLPLHAAWVEKENFALMTPLKHPEFQSNMVRFVVADSARRESFVIALDDPALIKQARDQIASPGSSINTIVVGIPGYGSNGVNQNTLNPLRTPWSWHVKKVLRFSFIGSEACGGTASVIEDLMRPWIDSEQSICFRDFRVIREIL